VAVVLVGAVGVGLASMAFAMPLKASVRLAALAGGSAAAVGIAAALLQMAMRRRRLGVQIAAAVAASVVAVGIGALVAARSMFISTHDLDTLLVILLAAGAAGTAIAVALGSRISAGSRALEAAARRIGAGDLGAEVPEPTAGELAAIGRELASMAERLQDAAVRERALESSRRELVAWVSHDLRTPLAAITAIAEALEDGVVEDSRTQARYHRQLRLESDRLARMVDELFELAVIQAGALRLELERMSLEDVVSEAIAGSSPAAEAKGIRVEGTVTPGGPVVEISPRHVARVLRNLLENAIRYTPHDGCVWVETGADADAAYVSVADGCGGIPEGDLERVFDTAFRVERARTPADDGGVGLGLAIARGLVEAHRGRISVRNQNGGCCFTVTLPRATSRPPADLGSGGRAPTRAAR
jgi:signal transduction histidine kinase